MKSMNKLLAVFASLALLFVFASCDTGSNTEDPAKQLPPAVAVGTWAGEMNMGGMAADLTFTIAANGNVNMTYEIDMTVMVEAMVTMLSGQVTAAEVWEAIQDPNTDMYMDPADMGGSSATYSAASPYIITIVGTETWDGLVTEEGTTVTFSEDGTTMTVTSLEPDEDEDGDPVVDENGDPVMVEMTMVFTKQ